jgi:hypothetical protein
MTRSLPGFLAAALAVAVLTPPVGAHHSFAAQYDRNKPITLAGTVTKMEWMNPHIYFYLDVKDEKGHVESWSFQTYALITLRRAGNDRQLFLDHIGKEVWVRGCLARNGRKNYAAAGTMKFSDGVMRQVGQLQD